jgi:tetratricopeptide (TPR) repeat protein
MTEVINDSTTPAPDFPRQNSLSPPLGMADQLHYQQYQQKNTKVLWAIFALLLVLVGTVFFVLPKYVSRPVVPTAATVETPAAESTPAAGITPFEEAQRFRQRETAQNTLAALLELQETLEQKQVLDWAAAPFNEALAKARTGDEAYAKQEFIQANDSYQASLEQLQQISAGQTAQYDTAMQAGNAAYQAGDAEGATAAYSQALLINPESTDASAGMDRAQVLTQVLERIEAGRNLQSGNQLEQAKEQYQQALALDASHAGAAAALADVNVAIAERNFAAAMSRGYAALQNKQPAEALEAFKQAQAMRPGADEVASAIQQANDQQTFAAVSVHVDAALKHEADENWQQAVNEWDLALAVDPNLVDAQEGQKRSNSRNNLDKFLTATISDPLRLAEENVYNQTAQVLADADRVISQPGPKLRNQLDQVRGFMERVRIPVNVVLQSDGMTSVTLLRMGELGMFTSHALDLTPGSYVAVGVRMGYRDVRQEFVVTIDGQAPVVNVACNEAI